MSLSTKVRQRLANDEGGFTLIELLIVLVIIGILLAIAVPSYLGFRERANERAAASNLRAAIPAAEAYYADEGTYDGMTLAELEAIDAGLALAAVNETDTAYCLEATVGDQTWSVVGPGGSPAEAPCA